MGKFLEFETEELMVEFIGDLDSDFEGKIKADYKLNELNEYTAFSNDTNKEIKFNSAVDVHVLQCLVNARQFLINRNKEESVDFRWDTVGSELI